MQNRNKLEIKFLLKYLFLRDSRRKSHKSKIDNSIQIILKKNFKKYLKKIIHSLLTPSS